MAGTVWRRPSVLMGTLVLAGVSMLYLRLWIVDYGFSSQDRELLRRQFDRASMDAMDESAYWRKKFDAEAESARQSAAKLLQANEELARANKTLAALQQEIARLRAQMAALNADLQATAIHRLRGSQLPED